VPFAIPSTQSKLNDSRPRYSTEELTDYRALALNRQNAGEAGAQVFYVRLTYSTLPRLT
jgi:hypothetical protein